MRERLQDLAADLKKHSSAEVYLDLPTRLLYSTDASNYQITPLAVVIPRHEDDVLATVEACIALDLPLLARGGGSSLAGQAVGEAVVLDFSKYLDALLSVDGLQRRAVVQPGITLAVLNRRLAPYGLMVGPDPASADRATLGGAIANNATGAHSIRYGMTADHVLGLRVLLADGAEARLGPLDREAVRRLAAGTSFEAGVYRQIIALLEAEAAVIREQFPTYWRRAGGYNLDRLYRQWQDGTLNLATLLAGSEGTLGVILAAELNLVPVPRSKALAILHYDEHDAAFADVPGLLGLEPAAIELIDDVLLGLTRDHPYWRQRLDFVVGRPAAVFAVEFAEDEEKRLHDRVQALRRYWAQHGRERPLLVLTGAEDQARVWQVRRAGLSLLASMSGDSKPTPCIEDVAVPPDRLAGYMADLRALLADRGIPAAMYAHASAGCIHVRPILNLKTAEGVRDLVELTAAAARLARHYGGVLSSEHGDGLARSYFNRDFFGPAVYDLFRQVKAIFDPHNRFNPGKIVDADPPDRHLRYGPDYRTVTPITVWDWEDEGGLARAVERCNGAAVCRKLDVGVMCPSFMALRDEKHTTRGRANLLREALTGRLSGGLTDPAVLEALDTCLGCKACKSECPSVVDMTRLKAETYAQLYRTRRPPLAALVFGHIDRVAALAAPVAPLANALLGFAPTRLLLARLLSVHPSRRFPRFHRRPFDRRVPAAFPAADRPRVALFPDTFTAFYEPEQGLAAWRVLTAAGFAVELTPRLCCGRPALSQGLVPQAQAKARRLVQALAPYARQGIPVVGLEPSCILTLRDDYPALVPGEETTLVAGHVRLFDEFLAEVLRERPDALALRPHRRRYLVHGHCHQKAVASMAPTLALLRAIPGAQAELIEAGCCGMAGAFGYDRRHYELSRTIAADRLLPALAANRGALIVANGTSCRHQILDLAGRQALHVAEALASVIWTVDDGR